MLKTFEMKVPKDGTKTLRVLLFILAHERYYARAAKYGEITRFICEMNGRDYDQFETVRDWQTGKLQRKRVNRGYWGTNLTLGRQSILKQYCTKIAGKTGGWVVSEATKRMLRDNGLMPAILSTEYYSASDATTIKQFFLSGKQESSLEKNLPDDSINDGSGAVSKTEVKSFGNDLIGVKAGEMYTIVGKSEISAPISSQNSEVDRLIEERRKLNASLKKANDKRIMVQMELAALQNEIIEINKLLACNSEALIGAVDSIQ